MGTQLAGMAAGLRSGWHWVSRATVTSGSVWCHAGIERSLFYPVSLRWIGCHPDQLQASYQQGWRGILWLRLRSPVPHPVYVCREHEIDAVFHQCLKPPLVDKLPWSWQLNYLANKVLALTTGLMKMMKFGWSIYGTTFSLSEKTCRW